MFNIIGRGDNYSGNKTDIRALENTQPSCSFVKVPPYLSVWGKLTCSLWLSHSSNHYMQVNIIYVSCMYRQDTYNLQCHKPAPLLLSTGKHYSSGAALSLVPTDSWSFPVLSELCGLCFWLLCDVLIPVVIAKCTAETCGHNADCREVDDGYQCVCHHGYRDISGHGSCSSEWALDMI